MEFGDVISLVGVLFICISWFVNSWLNRRNDIAKQRLEFRIVLFTSVIDMKRVIDNGVDRSEAMILLREKLEEVNLKVQLYGKADENNLFRCFVDAYNTYVSFNNEKNLDEVQKKLEAFMNIIITRYRKELGIYA